MPQAQAADGTATTRTVSAQSASSLQEQIRSVHRKWQKAVHKQISQALVAEAMEQRRRVAEQLASASAATTEVSSSEAALEAPLWLQGDADMYDDEALAKRLLLRRHPKVLAELQVWWETAQRSATRANKGQEPQGSLQQWQYVLMFRKVTPCVQQAHVARAHTHTHTYTPHRPRALTPSAKPTTESSLVSPLGLQVPDRSLGPGGGGRVCHFRLEPRLRRQGHDDAYTVLRCPLRAG